MPRILIGTSGWVYPHWRGRFYPDDLPQSKWLTFFSERFPTVEVNNTFYRLPRASTFAAWKQQSADGFVITVKGSRYITHIKRLSTPAASIRMLMTRAKRLGEKFGPVLFQLPPRFGINLARLEHFLKRLPRDHRFAMEFRDPSWHARGTYELLTQYGVAYCIMIGPKLKREEVATSDFIYIRFHAPDGSGPAFGPDRLPRWAESIRELTGRSRDGYIYFNNDAHGAALEDAVMLQKLLR